MVLFLNDVATSEVLLILVFILIFFGAKSIPGLARTLGRTIRQVKDASAEIQNEIKKSSGEMKKDLNLDQLLNDTANDIKRPLEQHKKDLEDAMKYQPKNSTSLGQPRPMPENLPKKEMNPIDFAEPCLLKTAAIP